MQNFTNILKPWTAQKSLKSEACQRSMLKKKALIDLHKCMGPACAYTTNDSSEMEHHLNSHTPTTRVLYCAYCLVKAGTARSVVNHVEEIHGKSRFQCLFCFYRAFEAGNVVYHQHIYHGDAIGANSTIIALPCQAMQTKADYLIEICTSFQNNHSLLSCSLCGSKHASVALFDAHVSLHSESKVTCPVCWQSLGKHEVRAHLNLHRSSFHKCLYCISSFNSKSDMYRHLCDHHSLKALYCALKMERLSTLYDIYVLENLGFDVPDSRLIVATYVNGNILLQSKMTDNKLLVVKRVKDTSLPKIVKVQGGIRIADDGTILNATDTISTNTTSASSISTSDRSSIKNTISGPSEAGTGIATVSKNNTVQASGDRTVPIGLSSHAKRKGTCNSSSLSDGSKCVQMQVNGEDGPPIGKIKKLENVPPSVPSGNSSLVSATTALSTVKLIIAGESTKTETAVTETSAVSTLANRTVSPVRRNIVLEVGKGSNPASGPIKLSQNIVKVKDFGFIKTSISESKEANPCGLRNVVKLTRLDNGTLVIKLPSPSKPDSQSVVGAPMHHSSCAATHMNAVNTELTDGNKDTSASEQNLATKNQILPAKPLHTAVATPTDISNADAAKSTVEEVAKSKAPTAGVVRVVKAANINTTSCVSPSKTIAGSSIEESVPNSNATVTGVNKTKAHNGFVRIMKSGNINTSVSPSRSVVGTSLEQNRPNSHATNQGVMKKSNAKIPPGFTRLVNAGTLHNSVSPATSATKQRIYSTPNSPHDASVPNANTAKSTIMETNQTKASTGVVRVVETSTNNTAAFPSKIVDATTMERSISNADAAKSTAVEVVKSKGSTGVGRVVKTANVNTSSCVSPSKTIVGSSIEGSVPNSNATQPTVMGVNKTKASNGRNNTKIATRFVRVVNPGTLYKSVSPATSATKEQVHTSPNSPHSASVSNAPAKSTVTETNKTKVLTGVVRVVETGTNNTALPSKTVVVTSMERNPVMSNSTEFNKVRPRSSSTAVNQVQSTPIDKLNSNMHKQSLPGIWTTKTSAPTASTTVAAVVTTSSKVVPGTAPPSSMNKQRNGNAPHQFSSLLPVWDRYRVDLSIPEVKIPFRFKGFRINYDSFYRSLLDLVSSKPPNPSEILICGAKDCPVYFGSRRNLAIHMCRSHMLFPSSVIPCKHCDCLLYGREDYVRHMLIHLCYKFVCLCRYHHCLLSNVVDHVRSMHKCDGFLLSLGHPGYKIPLEDVIVVIPSSFDQAEIAKSISCILTEENSANAEASVKAVADVTFKDNWSPVQTAIGDLYKCGFCQKVLPSELSFKNHLLLCEQRNADYYPCGHCEMRFLNWTNILSGICRHLFYHGENLYQCSTCNYKHFRRSVVMEHAKKHPNPVKSGVNILRESKVLWSCHVCPFRSVFQQAIMNHMQNAHNLPGQRYICSLCDDLMLTGIQSVRHYMHHHLGEKVTMLEMYNAISASDGEYCSEMIEDKMEGMHMRNITFMKVSSLEVDGPKSSLNALKSLNNNRCNTHDKSSPATHNYVDCEASEINDGKTVSNLLKRKAECLNDNTQSDPLMVDGNTQSETTVPDTQYQQQAKQICLVNESDCVHSSATNFEPPLSSKSQCSDLDTSLEYSTSSSSSQRRASKRVAAKSEHSRWLESVKFQCRTCDTSFGSLTELETHGNTNNSSNTTSCLSIGNAKRFRLLPLARCYYCNEQDTSSALLLHCVVKHPKHSFVCVDYTDSHKCGLCSFRNESSETVKLKNHFKLYHEVSEDKLSYYEYSHDTYLEWALCLGTPSNGILAELNHLLYICNVCNEESTNPIAMGMHIAQHFFKFACPRCAKEFKLLKVLYYHFLAMHLSEDLVVSPTVGDEYDEMLLDVLMLFQNGLIVSKREAQCTSVASLHELKLGLKSYNIEQLKLLDEYKTNLSLPIATIDNESSITDTCKTFIQKQTAHPVVELICLSKEDVASLQKKLKK